MDGDGRTGPVWGQEQRGRPPLHQTAILLQERHPRLSWSLGRGQFDTSDTGSPYSIHFGPVQFEILKHSGTVPSILSSSACKCSKSFLTGQRDAASASGSHVEPDWPRWSQPAPLAAHQQHPCVGRRPRPRQVGGHHINLAAGTQMNSNRPCMHYRA